MPPSVDLPLRAPAPRRSVAEEKAQTPSEAWREIGERLAEYRGSAQRSGVNDPVAHAIRVDGRPS